MPTIQVTPPTFIEIGARLGPFDLALLPNAAHEPCWFLEAVHPGAVRVNRAVWARQSLAMHHGTFQLTDDAIDAPAAALAFTRQNAGVQADEFDALACGENKLLKSS